MKVFLSQPFNGLFESEILEVQDKMKRYYLNHLFNEHYHDVKNIEFVSAYIPKSELKYLQPPLPNRIWFLGRAIELLSECTFCLFAEDFMCARGCMIEYQVCVEYGIEYDIIGSNS